MGGSCNIDWLFLFLLLDDEGYTSLGSRKTTIPNSSLKTDDGKYLPAHKLRDAKDERLSRIE